MTDSEKKITAGLETVGRLDWIHYRVWRTEDGFTGSVLSSKTLTEIGLDRWRLVPGEIGFGEPNHINVEGGEGIEAIFEIFTAGRSSETFNVFKKNPGM